MESKRPHFNRAAVIGIGLIGASFALAARRAGLVDRVIGVARKESTRSKAEEIGAADETTDDAAAAAAGADLIYLATPVDTMPHILETIAPVLQPGCLVTDAGSVKELICRQAEAILPPDVAFVGGHPMAGSERSGPEHANPTLFEGRTYFLVPTRLGGPEAAAVVAKVVEGIGAQPTITDAQTHDRLLAATSHLPHAIAYALMLAVADLVDDDQLPVFSGTGLMDTTRIAGSPPELWRGIFVANAANLETACGVARRYLNEIADAARAGDEDRLAKLLSRAQAARARLDPPRPQG